MIQAKINWFDYYEPPEFDPYAEFYFDFYKHDLMFPVKKINKEVLKLGMIEIENRKLSIFIKNES